MNESAGMANIPLTIAHHKTLVPCEVISETPNTVTVDEKEIYNSVLKGALTLALYKLTRL